MAESVALLAAEGDAFGFCASKPQNRFLEAERNAFGFRPWSPTEGHPSRPRLAIAARSQRIDASAWDDAMGIMALHGIQVEAPESPLLPDMGFGRMETV